MAMFPIRVEAHGSPPPKPTTERSREDRRTVPASVSSRDSGPKFAGRTATIIEARQIVLKGGGHGGNKERIH